MQSLIENSELTLLFIKINIGGCLRRLCLYFKNATSSVVKYKINFFIVKV